MRDYQLILGEIDPQTGLPSWRCPRCGVLSTSWSGRGDINKPMRYYLDNCGHGVEMAVVEVVEEARVLHSVDVKTKVRTRCGFGLVSRRYSRKDASA